MKHGAGLELGKLEGKLTMYNVKISDFGLLLGHTINCDWITGGGFKHLFFSPLPGEMIQFDQYFSDGLKPPTRLTRAFLEGFGMSKRYLLAYVD